MQDPVAYRPRRTPAQNEALWSPLGRRMPRQEGALGHNEWQRLAAFFLGYESANALDLEPYAAQHLFNHVLASIDAEEALEHFTWQSLKYHELAHILLAHDVFDVEDEDESGDVLSFIDGRIERLRKLYEFKDRMAVEGFLRENPFLFDLLENAHDKIQEYFDFDTPMALDVIREPDAKSSGRLFVLILTTLRPKEALAHLDELDRDWWLDVLPAARGKLTIDIYYS